jgi:hypothetical protein
MVMMNVAPAHRVLMWVLLSSAGDWKAGSISTHWAHMVRRWASQVMASVNEEAAEGTAAERPARAKARPRLMGSKCAPLDKARIA